MTYLEQLLSHEDVHETSWKRYAAGFLSLKWLASSVKPPPCPVHPHPVVEGTA